MKPFRVPHTLILLGGMIVLALLLTWILPQGEFARVEHDGHAQVVPGSYAKVVDPERPSPLTVFTAIPAGFQAAAGIIFFIFLVGGAFGVLRATGAVDAMIASLLRAFGSTPQLLIGGTILVFALGSATIGMAEEYIPFVPVLVALAIGLGFDAVTAVGILCVGYGIGYGIAPVNPFTVMVAQGISGLEPTSGWWYRVVIAGPFLALGIHHVWRYAKRVGADPSTSLVADIAPPITVAEGPDPVLTRRHLVILGLTALTIPLIVVGVSEQLSGWGWYVDEIAALFLGLTVLIAIVAGMGPSRAAAEFCAGAAELTTTALLVGFARTILVVLEEGRVVDTIVHGIATPLQAVAPSLAAIGMLVVQSLCNLFIPSGSGQAYVTMPIMAPIADLVGISRQTAVLAYQFGDGFTNILVPTNAVLIGILSMAGVPYDRWLRFILPFMLKVWALAALAMAVAVWIDYV